jgi:hypothetical protein
VQLFLPLPLQLSLLLPLQLSLLLPVFLSFRSEAEESAVAFKDLQP